MTNLYFVRHAEPNYNNHDDMSRELTEKGLKDRMKAKDFLGINVTIPYKSDVIPYLDYIDPVAEKIGAVNTIVNRDGKLYGYNTDFGGMKMLIEKATV